MQLFNGFSSGPTDNPKAVYPRSDLLKPASTAPLRLHLMTHSTHI